jgi:type I restriction enzyme M protein
MFVQSMEFIRAHANGNGNGGKAKADISIYGQESNYTTWRLAKMNLAIRGIDGQIAHGDTFHNDRHPDLKADFILANPPFNISDWGGERLRGDKRWQYGDPPAGNANFAWVQHIVHHLAPAGVAGLVLSNGSMSSNTSGEGEIRKKLIEENVVDCMVALPGQLFYSTQIPACLWFLARDRKNHKFRDRRGEVLFIDARKMGFMVDRTHRDLSDEDLANITGMYHLWRGETDVPPEVVDGRTAYEDIPGFCKAASLEEIRKHGHVLTPGRYVGAEAAEEDAEPFADKMARLVADLRAQQAEAARLDAAIDANLRELGYGGWPLAMRAIGEATGCTDEAVREFLDSRHGRHFADDVANGVFDGLEMEAAIDAAIDRWLGWTTDGYMESELGIPRGIPYLTGLVTHYEIMAELEGTA